MMKMISINSGRLVLKIRLGISKIAGSNPDTDSNIKPFFKKKSKTVSALALEALKPKTVATNLRLPKIYQIYPDTN